ncbi:Metaphase-anaphase transition protein [Apiospora rasikravindrae]|uniref:Metaphase-anaphase transition protein n=1 Tax=Apiospora rasikravindrae TaxID=990691 RepID=A0ABR1SE01_9PEZI
MADHPTAAPEGSNDAIVTISGTTNDAGRKRRDSENSQTAAEFLRDQMQLEADAREALPYSIENCTKQLGTLRQSVFACLTCHPPPTNPDDSTAYKPAGVCYACSVQCHGEHELVEIFQKRNFTCDCGTTRFAADQPCTLRINPATNTKGGVHSEAADPNNKYNQNFRNRFCSCSIDYVPQEQKGTMFQCLGLGTHETGGCGEDWYHPGCLVGLGPRWYEKMTAVKNKKPADANTTSHDTLPTISEDGPAPDGNGADEAEDEDDDNDAPLPEGFPGEDDFNHFLCYKCVEANPWIKRYAGTAGFLSPIYFSKDGEENNSASASSNKRKLDDEEQASEPKRAKTEEVEDGQSAEPALPVRAAAPASVKSEQGEDKKEPAAPSFESTTTCNVPLLEPHPQLLDEEEVYEPPLSEGEGSNDGASTHGSGSLYERGESALRNVDRVRAIEGVMAYKQLKDKLTPFFEEFAKSGKAIGADDIKEYFAKLRGDEQAIKDAGQAAKDGGDDNHRQEQSGY